jgi:AraC-like DNA-binding protein
VFTAVWRHRTPVGADALRVVPDGMLDIVIRSGAEPVVAGPSIAAEILPASAGASTTGLQVRPGACRPLLGVPAHALRNARVPLRDLVGNRAVDRLLAVQRPDAALGCHWSSRQGPPVDPLAAVVLQRVVRGDAVTAIADDVGVSDRHLRRRCLDAFGHAPRQLRRIVRLQLVMAMLRRETAWPLARLAADAGYFDESHLHHDVRDLVGVSPARLRTLVAMAGTYASPAVGSPGTR